MGLSDKQKKQKKNPQVHMVTFSPISNNRFLCIPFPCAGREEPVAMHRPLKTTYPITIRGNKSHIRDHNIHSISRIPSPPRLPRRKPRMSTHTLSLILLLPLPSRSLSLSRLLPATPDHNHAQETSHNCNPDQNQNDWNPDRPYARRE